MSRPINKIRRFRTTLIAFSLLLALGPMLLLAVPILVQLYKEAYSASIRRVDQNANLAAYDLARAFDLIFAQVESIARSNDVIIGMSDYLLRTVISHELRRFHAANPSVVKIGVYSTKHLPIVTDPPAMENGLRQSTNDPIIQKLKSIKIKRGEHRPITFALSGDQIRQIHPQLTIKSDEHDIAGFMSIIPIYETFSATRHVGYVVCVISSALLIENIQKDHYETAEIKITALPKPLKFESATEYISSRVPWRGSQLNHFQDGQDIFVELSDERALYFKNVRSTMVQVIVIALFAVFLVAFIATLAGRKMVEPLHVILRLARNYSKGDLTARAQKLKYKEFDEVKTTLEAMAAEIAKSVNLANEKAHVEAELKFTKALVDLAEQVGHDVRSPLAVLRQLVAQDGFRISGTQLDQKILSQAVNRIGEIVEDLSTKPRSLLTNKIEIQKERAEFNHTNGTTSCDVIAIIAQIIAEKRVRHQQHKELRIGFLSFPYSALFVMASRSDLARILSNILNNAIEAAGANVQVLVAIEKETDNQVVVTVRDNGPGISEAILKRIGNKGATFGKPEGSGLGLYHAKVKLAEWAGALDIESTPQKGTTIKIVLRAAPQPSWSVTAIEVFPDSSVYIVDDDQLTHDLWTARILNLRRLFPKVDMHAFFKPEDFFEFSERNALKSNDVVIMDYEFRTSAMSGLEAIVKSRWAARTFLLSGRASDPSLQIACEKNSVKLISKEFEHALRFSCEEEFCPQTLVLVDDDPWIRSGWELDAKEQNASLVTFANAEEFFQVVACLRRDSILYIDYELRDQILGSDIARRLVKYGYPSTFLTSGHSADWLEQNTGIKDVVGKQFPKDAPLKKPTKLSS